MKQARRRVAEIPRAISTNKLLAQLECRLTKTEVLLESKSQPRLTVLEAMSLGSLINPIGFLALAIRPNIRQNPTSLFGVPQDGQFHTHDDWLRRRRLFRCKRRSARAVTLSTRTTVAGERSRLCAP
jgi:hypothetical protein